MSPAVNEKARKFCALVLQRLAGRAAAVAAELNMSESTLSRWKSDDLERACGVIAAAGLKVVPASYRCMPDDELNALLTLARGRLERAHSLSELFPEEDPE